MLLIFLFLLLVNIVEEFLLEFVSLWYADVENYCASLKDTGESVAIKVMKKFNLKQMSHLLSLQDRELEVLQKLDHPNIVKLIDVELEPGNVGEVLQGMFLLIINDNADVTSPMHKVTSLLNYKSEITCNW